MSETLYLAEVWPFARCGDLEEADWARLHAAASDVIQRSYSSQRALAEQQASSGSPISATRGTTYSFELHVFRRPCTADGAPVRRDEGPHKRSVYWVPERQRRGMKPADADTAGDQPY